MNRLNAVFETDHLQRLVDRVGAAVNFARAGAVNPVFGCLLLEASAGRLSVLGYDRDLWCRSWSDEPGLPESDPVLVSAAAMAESLRLVETASVRLTAEPDGLRMEAGRWRRLLPTRPDRDTLPSPPGDDGEVGFEVVSGGPSLAFAIGEAAKTVESGSGHRDYDLSGVLLDAADGGPVYAVGARGGTMLCVAAVGGTDRLSPGQAYLPLAVSRSIERVAAKSPDLVSVRADGRLCRVEMPGWQLTAPLLAGNPPPWRRFVPKFMGGGRDDPPQAAAVPDGRLTKAIDQARAGVDRTADLSNRLWLRIAPGGFEVEGKGSGDSVAAGDLPGYDGPESEDAFDPDVLRRLTAGGPLTLRWTGRKPSQQADGLYRTWYADRPSGVFHACMPVQSA